MNEVLLFEISHLPPEYHVYVMSAQ